MSEDHLNDECKNPCSCATGLCDPHPSLISAIGVENPPGRTCLRYRIGTHGSFKEAMILAAAHSPGLAKHTSRDDSSASNALLDVGAALLDILTFYQERIINEGYLPTATERLSLLELARAIGYELKPGVAASTYLAFEVQTAPGMPDSVQIPIGVQVQTIPLPGEQPQIFETVEDADARPEWNRIIPKQTRPQSWVAGKSDITVAGTGFNLPVGSRVLILYSALEDDDWEVAEIAEVDEDFDRGATRWVLAQPLEGPDGSIADDYPRIHTFAIEARPFGHNAPDWKTLPADAKRAVLGLADDATIPPENANQWPNFVIHLPFDFLSRFGDSHVIGDFVSLIDDIPGGGGGGSGGGEGGGTIIIPMILLFEQFRASTLSLDAEYKNIVTGSLIYLDDPEGTQVIAVDGVETISRSAFAVSGKSTIITADDTKLEPFRESVRSLTVLAASIEREIAEELDPAAVSGSEILIGGDCPELPIGRQLAIQGTDAITGEAISERIAVKSATRHLTEDAWIIELESELEHDYDRASTALHGNLALATHGQSHVEVLAHGDARQKWVRMALSHSPLTHLASSTHPSGAVSALELRVGSVAWSQVDSFYEAQPDAEIFIVRTNDSGVSFVQTGDGKTGSRIHTGPNMVKAIYRSGLGSGGNLETNRLTNLMSRPLGLQGVAQPLPATGGEDPETRDNSRINAPLTVKTLDRLVSLTDYADFARAYAGIAKAQSAWGRFGLTQGILLTVAGVDGAVILEESELWSQFHDALHRYRDPTVPFRIVNYISIPFELQVKLYCDSRYEPDAITTIAEELLFEHFSFQARALGQAVTSAEVITLLQNIDGVLGVDLDALNSIDEAPIRRTRIPARSGFIDRHGTVFPAELITLDPGGITLTIVDDPLLQ